MSKKDTTLTPIKGVEILINQDALEPEEYFTILKSGKLNITNAELEGQLSYLAETIIAANSIGQDRLADRATFIASTVVRELKLKEHGITQFISESVLREFNKKVMPRGSVKLIELDRYPRVIPAESVQEIKRIKDLDIFDDFIVAFTDLTNNNYQSTEDKKFIARNRDPIVFGIFKQDGGQGDIFDRVYFITDWADDYCDLTFDKMVGKLAPTEHGILLEDSKALIDSLLRVDDIDDAIEIKPKKSIMRSIRDRFKSRKT